MSEDEFEPPPPTRARRKRQVVDSEDEEEAPRAATARPAPRPRTKLARPPEDSDEDPPPPPREEPPEIISLDSDAEDSEEIEEIEQAVQQAEALHALEQGEMDISTAPERLPPPPLRVDWSQEAEAAFQSLSEEQQRVLLLALEQRYKPSTIDGKKAGWYGKNVCILGEAGTGKSHLLKALRVILQERVRASTPGGKGIVVMSATTQYVAYGYGAQNVNKLFHFVPKFDPKTHKVIRSSKLIPHKAREEWKDVCVLIIDEVSMLSRYMLQLMDEHLQVAKGNKLPFGGVQLILCGDFKQLAPVQIVKDDRDHPINQEPIYAFKAPVWKELFDRKIGHIAVLRQQHRQGSDGEFLRLLRAVRNKTCTAADYRILKSMERDSEPEGSTVVCPFNGQADQHNDKMVRKLPGASERITGMLSQVSVPKDWVKNGCKDKEVHRRPFSFGDRNDYKTPQELRNKCKVPYSFDLKRGARIVMAVNHPMHSWCVNGAQGTLIDFVMETDDEGDEIIKALRVHIDGEPEDVTHDVELYPFILDENETKTQWVEYMQFPILRGYAISVHGAQGMTMERVHVKPDSWAPYMLYVALSRGKTMKGVTLQRFDTSHIQVCPHVEGYYEDEGIGRED
jgi:ATP-dependent DNA helicase PIF1